MRYVLFALCLAGCGYLNKGDDCVTGGANVKLCNSGLVCCAPDVRVSDQHGVCTEKTDLGVLDQACGVTSGKCCALGLHCEVSTATGDGKCVQ